MPWSRSCELLLSHLARLPADLEDAGSRRAWPTSRRRRRSLVFQRPLSVHKCIRVCRTQIQVSTLAVSPAIEVLEQWFRSEFGPTCRDESARWSVRGDEKRQKHLRLSLSFRVPRSPLQPYSTVARPPSPLSWSSLQRTNCPLAHPTELKAKPSALSQPDATLEIGKRRKEL